MTVPELERPTRPSKREAASVYVVGFWKRLVAAAIDLAIVIPSALIITLLASKIAGIHLPPSNMHLLDVDLWIDLVLATDPALIMGFVLFFAIGMVYLLVFHGIRGRTLGMQVMKMKVIDVYGDPPLPLARPRAAPATSRVSPRCSSVFCGSASTARSAGSTTGSPERT